MRFLLFSFFVFINVAAYSQLSLIENYSNKTRLIYLDDDEPVIMVYDILGNHIDIYAEDLSLVSSIDIPVDFSYSTLPYKLFHVSRSLFDCDSTNIEYLISYGGVNDGDPVFVKVFREDGEELFSLDGYTFWDNSGYSTNPDPGMGMIEVEDGVLIQFTEGPLPGVNSSIYHSCGNIPGIAYSLPGTSTVDIAESENKVSLVSLFPNPGTSFFKLEYSLPPNCEYGKLVVYDTQGKVAYSKKVGKAMNFIKVNTNRWLAGNYEVVLRSPEDILLTQTFIKIKVE